jgi:hypothetical protein
MYNVTHRAAIHFKIFTARLNAKGTAAPVSFIPTELITRLAAILETLQVNAKSA